MKLPSEGIWLMPREFAALFKLTEQSLANARARERKTGRRSPHAPIWRKFGRSVRYWIP
jgi:hypothetical protein